MNDKLVSFILGLLWGLVLGGIFVFRTLMDGLIAIILALLASILVITNRVKEVKNGDRRSNK